MNRDGQRAPFYVQSVVTNRKVQGRRGSLLFFGILFCGHEDLQHGGQHLHEQGLQGDEPQANNARVLKDLELEEAFAPLAERRFRRQNDELQPLSADCTHHCTSLRGSYERDHPANSHCLAHPERLGRPPVEGHVGNAEGRPVAEEVRPVLLEVREALFQGYITVHPAIAATERQCWPDNGRRE